MRGVKQFFILMSLAILVGACEQKRIRQTIILMRRKAMIKTDWGGYPDSTFFTDNYFFVEEPNLAIEPTKSTNNFYKDNFYIGALKIPSTGFSNYNGQFNKNMWYDAKDANWNKLISFLKDKTVPLSGREIPVFDIIEL